MMKFLSKLILVTICIVTSINIVEAQRFKGEIMAGVNFNQIDGDMVVGYKHIGAKAGIGAMLPFSWKKYNTEKPWALSMEILYNGKGARERNFNYLLDSSSSNFFDGKFKYKMNLDYISIPIMLQYYDKNTWAIGVGLQYSRLVNSKEIEYDILQTYDTIPPVKPNDLLVFVDVRYRIWQQLKIGFRFEYSIISMRTRHFQATTYYDEQTRKQRNNSLSLYLVYMLNEAKIEKKKEEKKKLDRTYYY